MPQHNYFEPEEFKGWQDKLNPCLKPMLNEFRKRWGKPVHVSPHPDAVGRNNGDENSSSHNLDYWGEVNAIDLFPEGMTTAKELFRAQKIAVEVGFTGIGLYTDTKFKGKDHPMLHLDVRPTRLMGDPAMWSRIEGEYKGICFAMKDLEAGLS